MVMMGQTVYNAIEYARKRARETRRVVVVWRRGEQVGASAQRPDDAIVLGHADPDGNWHEAVAA